MLNVNFIEINTNKHRYNLSFLNIRKRSLAEEPQRGSIRGRW